MSNRGRWNSVGADAVVSATVLRKGGGRVLTEWFIYLIGFLHHVTEDSIPNDWCHKMMNSDIV